MICLFFPSWGKHKKRVWYFCLCLVNFGVKVLKKQTFRLSNYCRQEILILWNLLSFLFQLIILNHYFLNVCIIIQYFCGPQCFLKVSQISQKVLFLSWLFVCLSQIVSSISPSRLEGYSWNFGQKIILKSTEEWQSKRVDTKMSDR